MQTATPIFREDAAHQVTLAAHTQAVERAIQAMHTHLHEVLTLEDLASVAYLSPSHFHRVFHRLIGIPPGEFLSALRLQMARRLLLTTPLSVTDICFEVGYNSIGSFTSRFTHLVGLSPRLLRQRAHAFEPLAGEHAERSPTTSSDMPMHNALLGRISAPAPFRGTIYVGLFPSPIPQGAPVRCTTLSSPGLYLLHGMADGIYHLRAAARKGKITMRKVVVSEYVTLDGVFEDPGGGEKFEHGGWSFQFWGEESAKFKFDELFASDALLLGRVTYEGFAKAWPTMKDEGGFADRMNSLPKYVVSTTLKELAWNNSHLMKGNIAEEVARLKQQEGKDILIAGSGELVHTLRQHDLIDEYRLMVHPVVLGSGRRLFKDGSDKTVLRLVDTKPFSSGIVVLYYEPAKK